VLLAQSHADTLDGMRHLSIGFNAYILFLLFAGGLANGQDKPTTPQDSPPFLKQCSDKNPPPCADKPPTLISAPDPDCSQAARKAKIKGTVALAVVVGTDGVAHDISVVTPVGYGLDEEAVKAVKRWRFNPGKGSGKPAPVQIRIEAAFLCY
jgi:TonB family protein